MSSQELQNTVYDLARFYEASQNAERDFKTKKMTI